MIERALAHLQATDTVFTELDRYVSQGLDAELTRYGVIERACANRAARRAADCVQPARMQIAAAIGALRAWLERERELDAVMAAADVTTAGGRRYTGDSRPRAGGPR